MLYNFTLAYDFGFAGNHSLDRNITEFGEGIIYYILLLYVVELYHKLKKQSL